ncbi:MAG: hypothetical protein LUP95_02710 [Euryarchaeota archaeon]|nr:hypothetical protein [Euryarchaeota archaeon]
MAGYAFITKFRIASSTHETSQPFFTGIPRDVVEKIHQRADLSAVYYTPKTVFTQLKSSWPVVTSTFIQLRDIPADSVVLFHCSTYAQRYDYHAEEANMKAIVLSKDYDIGICTGRSFARHYCSDLMYADRLFSYRFGDRKYWFVCYSSTLDDLQLISDKLEDLFGTERGQEIFAKLSQMMHPKWD